MDNVSVGGAQSAAVTRREFLTQVTGGAIATGLLGGELVRPLSADASPAAPTKAGKARTAAPYNILFIFTDQERYLSKLPAGLVLPGKERLRAGGVTFHNHYCPAVMCTSSRSVIVTGLQTADNRMFENSDVPWIQPLSTKIPTLGHMLRKNNYYTAYKGKWHLNKDFESTNPDKLFTTDMEKYGFADYAWPGDLLAHAGGGYRYDHMIAGGAISWLRAKGQPLNEEGKPWSLAVSLVNPHDIMYFNTDAPGEHVQDNGALLMHSTRAPNHSAYKSHWNVPLPPSLKQSFQQPGRPQAHGEYNKAWGYTLGLIPPEVARWNRFNDYYFNSIRAVDAQLLAILSELDALKLTERTIVVFTSDHGEMGGAHGLRGKGPFAYQESVHLPFYVVHPDVRGGQSCQSLTGHIDIVPTLLGMSGMDKAKIGEAAGRDLPGKDISAALGNVAAAKLHTVRDAALFTYSGLAQNDSNLVRVCAEGAAKGKDIATSLKDEGFKPDLRKRGSLRTVVDGRYKFTRYFAPIQRNRPTNIAEIYKWNDVELFDLEKDPAEMTNLGATAGKNDALVTQMNDKLNAEIAAEIGKDDGREMPDYQGIAWAVQRLDM